MAKKNMKVFSEYMTSVLPASEITVSYSFGDEQSFEVQTFDVRVKTMLTADEKATFVDRVANNCFSDDGNFRPEMRDILFQITLLQMLTDVPVFSVKMDELDETGASTGKKIEIVDIDKTYNFCKCLSLYEKADDPIFRSLHDELKHLVAEKIIFLQQRVLMGEKRLLEKTREEMETGIALINSIGDQLNGALSNVISNNSALSATSEFADRMKGVSDEQLIKTILGK